MRTDIGEIAGAQPGAEEQRFEVLDRGAVDQDAAGLGLDTEHLGPERRDEHLAVTEPAGVLDVRKGAVHEVDDREVGVGWVRST